MLICNLINILCLPQEVPHRQIWINHFLRCSATFPMAWAGVQVARRQVALAPPEISSLLPRPLLMEEISPHWGTCRPLPLSHLLSPPVLVLISSPIQVRKMDKKMFIAFFSRGLDTTFFHWKILAFFPKRNTFESKACWFLIPNFYETILSPSKTLRSADAF